MGLGSEAARRPGEVCPWGLGRGVSTDEAAVCSEFREVDPERNWLMDPQSKILGMPIPLSLRNFTFVKLM